MSTDRPSRATPSSRPPSTPSQESTEGWVVKTVGTPWMSIEGLGGVVWRESLESTNDFVGKAASKGEALYTQAIDTAIQAFCKTSENRYLWKTSQSGTRQDKASALGLLADGLGVVGVHFLEKLLAEAKDATRQSALFVLTTFLDVLQRSFWRESEEGFVLNDVPGNPRLHKYKKILQRKGGTTYRCFVPEGALIYFWSEQKLKTLVHTFVMTLIGRGLQDSLEFHRKKNLELAVDFCKRPSNYQSLVLKAVWEVYGSRSIEDYHLKEILKTSKTQLLQCIAPTLNVPNAPLKRWTAFLSTINLSKEDAFLVEPLSKILDSTMTRGRRSRVMEDRVGTLKSTLKCVGRMVRVMDVGCLASHIGLKQLTSTLYRLCHHESTGLKMASMGLLYQLLTHMKGDMEHFARTLYSEADDGGLISTAGRRRVMLNLLQSCSSMVPTESCYAIYRKLLLTSIHTADHDAYSDILKFNIPSCPKTEEPYDPNARNPQYAHASGSPLFEKDLLRYRPTFT